MAGERVTLWTSAAAAGAAFVAVAISAAIIWNSAGKQRAQFVAELAALNTKLDAVNAKIDKAGETVTEIKKITSVETTTKALEQLNSEIKKTNDGLAKLQKTSSLDGVKTTLAKLDAEIGKTATALADIKKSTATDLVKGDLAGIETRLASLAAGIEAKLESAIGELKTGIADNASSQSKSLAEIASSIAALKTTATAAQMAAQQAAQKVEKAVAVARPPAPPAPDVTASIPVVQPLIVNFGAAGRAGLDAQTNKVIANLKTIMKDRRGCAISVAGYADTLGRDDVNLDVSKERADLVATKLRTAFAGRNVRIDSVGWGERKLKVWTPDGRRQMANRRVAVSVDCKG
jgi:outer membrane protein OmpA-like peptidoglycan-associated protein